MLEIISRFAVSSILRTHLSGEIEATEVIKRPIAESHAHQLDS